MTYRLPRTYEYKRLKDGSQNGIPWRWPDRDQRPCRWDGDGDGERDGDGDGMWEWAPRVDRIPVDFQTELEPSEGGNRLPYIELCDANGQDRKRAILHFPYDDSVATEYDEDVINETFESTPKFHCGLFLYDSDQHAGEVQGEHSAPVRFNFALSLSLDIPFFYNQIRRNGTVSYPLKQKYVRIRGSFQDSPSTRLCGCILTPEPEHDCISRPCKAMQGGCPTIIHSRTFYSISELDALNGLLDNTEYEETLNRVLAGPRQVEISERWSEK